MKRYLIAGLLLLAGALTVGAQTTVPNEVYSYKVGTETIKVNITSSAYGVAILTGATAPVLICTRANALGSCVTLPQNGTLHVSLTIASGQTVEVGTLVSSNN